MCGCAVLVRLRFMINSFRVFYCTRVRACALAVNAHTKNNKTAQPLMCEHFPHPPRPPNPHTRAHARTHIKEDNHVFIEWKTCHHVQFSVRTRAFSQPIGGEGHNRVPLLCAPTSTHSTPETPCRANGVDPTRVRQNATTHTATTAIAT